ncbi:MAG: multicopper oxidase family protein, partial [Specibacter sp.]
MTLPLNRRSLLGLSVAAAAAAALAACTPATRTPTQVTRIMPGDPVVAEYESKRPATGTSVTQQLAPAPFTTMLA